MKVCICCRAYIATKYHYDGEIAVPLCTECFMKMDARLLYAVAKADREIRQLEKMWAVDNAWVKR